MVEPSVATESTAIGAVSAVTVNSAGASTSAAGAHGAAKGVRPRVTVRVSTSTSALMNDPQLNSVMVVRVRETDAPSGSVKVKVMAPLWGVVMPGRFASTQSCLVAWNVLPLTMLGVRST